MDFWNKVKNECNCATGDACETHTHDHACCDFQCCGKTLEIKEINLNNCINKKRGDLGIFLCTNLNKLIY